MLPIIRYRHAVLAAILIAGTGLFTGAYADPQQDPPGRVARLNYISGQVSFRPASLDDWGVATVNYPLTTGDHLWTERDASAELHVASSVLRLAPETAFSLLNLDDQVLQARLAEGTIDVRIRDIYDREIYEVDTPNAAVSILAPGIYRIDVDPDGSRTRVTVRTGEVQVDGNGRTFSVYPGQMVDLIGEEDGGFVVRRAAAPDRWELWCRDRDRREDNRVALNYVSRDMIGYEDLDDYGTWNYEPEYGYGWTPTVVSVDWAPYRYGHWSYVRPWGWTWIDQARWGFAPFHYGRWAFRHDRWMWFPGQPVPRPIWAPALVAFVGGPHWDFSFAVGVRPAVGWFPLAPGELYCPSYYASRVYVRNVNVTSVNITTVNITNVNVATLRYANRGVAGAVTAVPRDMFAAAQPTQRVGTAVPRLAAERTPVVGHAAAIAPGGAASVLGHVPTSAARPPASVFNRAVVTRTEPPAAAARTAPVGALPERGRPAGERAASGHPDARGEGGNAEAAARPRANANTADPGSASGTPDRATANDSRSNRGRGTADSDRPPTGRTDPSTAPRDWSGSSPVGAARPRDPESAAGWRAPARSTETSAPRAPQNERPSDSGSRYERPTARSERPTPTTERSAPREDRPSVGGRDTSAPSGSARPRGEDRPSTPAPARTERSEPSKSEVRAPASAPPQSARPAPGAAERPAQSGSGGRGGQSEGSARPRGGRGGQ